MSQSKSVPEALGFTNARIDSIIESLAAHPYLWAFAVCLLIHPFYLGSEENVPNNAMLIEALLVLAVGFWAIYRLYKGELLGKKRRCSNCCAISVLRFIGS